MKNWERFGLQISNEKTHLKSLQYVIHFTESCSKRDLKVKAISMSILRVYYVWNQLSVVFLFSFTFWQSGLAVHWFIINFPFVYYNEVNIVALMLSSDRPPHWFIQVYISIIIVRNRLFSNQHSEYHAIHNH